MSDAIAAGRAVFGDYRTGNGVWSVAIGELSGDRNADLATANTDDGTVSVLVNKGDGTFQTRLDYANGPQPHSVAIADLNSDGKGDLTTANADLINGPRPGTVSVLLANAADVCVVPDVAGTTVAAAKQSLARSNCRVGHIRRAYSPRVKRGHVISLTPGPRRVLRSGAKVDLVVSLGRKR